MNFIGPVFQIYISIADEIKQVCKQKKKGQISAISLSSTVFEFSIFFKYPNFYSELRARVNLIRFKSAGATIQEKTLDPGKKKKKKKGQSIISSLTNLLSHSQFPILSGPIMSLQYNNCTLLNYIIFHFQG